MKKPVRRSRTAIGFTLAAIMAASLSGLVETGFAATSKPVIDLSVKTEGVIDATMAMKKAERGAILLLDIRSPQEWKETGVGSAAKRISMHQRGFLKKLHALMGDDKTKPVALICAVGGRSHWLQGELKKRGYTNVLDVSEGMLGSRTGPGWLKRGLPMVK